MKNALKLLVPLAVVIVIAGGSWWGYKTYYKDKVEISFKTEEVQLEDLTSSISASGTVEPEELINVGAQVSGKIMAFGKDTDGNSVDYRSYVKAGTLLAQIDDVLYKAALDEAEARQSQAEAAVISAKAAIASAEASGASARASVDAAGVDIRKAEIAIETAKAAIASAEASVASAEAQIAAAKAVREQNDAKLILAKNNWERAQALRRQNAMSASEYDTYSAEFISAKAAIASADAELARAKASRDSAVAALSRAKTELESSSAGVIRARADKKRAEADEKRAEAELGRANADFKHAQAQLKITAAELIKARRNLDYCAITAPVDGIIIDRRVSLGQTVVSSMSASSIFLIAKDLKKMEVWVSVNEADISHIKPGMAAEFTIDTFPGSVFTGTVKKVRLNATMSQNVVTYIVEVVTDNSDGKLIPYLTANVKFIRERRKNVLTVSNAALRFKPAPELIVPELRDKTFDEKSRILYVAEGQLLRPVEVKTGLNAGGRVEILDPPFKAGDVIVYGATEVSAAKDNSGDKRSPFMPKPDNSKARGGGSAANRARSQGK